MPPNFKVLRTLPLKAKVAVLAVFSTVLLMGGGIMAAANATTTDGASRETPVWVNDPADVPTGAVEDDTPQLPEGTTLGKCDTARTWVVTTPGAHHDETSHAETRWSRVIPGHEETAHAEYRYIKVTPGIPAVTEYKYKKPATQTEWQVGKVYAEDVVDYTRYSWNPGKHDDPDNPPPFPSQKWQKNNKGYNGTDPVGSPFRAGNGESWFYWDAEVSHHAGDHHALYGPYTVTSDPFTVPFNVGSGSHVIGELFDYGQPNEDGGNGVVDYKYVLVSGPTEVPTGGYEYYHGGDWTTDVLDAPWVKIDERTKPGTGTPEVTEYYPVDGESYTTDPAPEGFSLRDSIEVGNGDAVADKTVYWSKDGDTESLTDANWSTYAEDAGPEGYTFVDKRTVKDKDGYDDPPTYTYYAWQAGKTCPSETPTTTPTPSESPTPTTPVTHNTPPKSTNSTPVTPTTPPHAGGVEQGAPFAFTPASFGLIGVGMVLAGTAMALCVHRRKASV